MPVFLPHLSYRHHIICSYVDEATHRSFPSLTRESLKLATRRINRVFDFYHRLRSHLYLFARSLGKCLGGLLVFEQTLDFDRDFDAFAARWASFHGV